MGRLKGSIALVVGGMGLAGCATSAVDLAPEGPNQPWVSARTANGTDTAPRGYVLPANPILASLPPAAPVQASQVYSLPDLIDLAETNNPTTRMAWGDAKRVALTVGVVRSLYLPKIAVSVIGGEQASTGQDSAAGSSLNDGGSLHGTISALSLQWLLFDFGERDALVDVAKQASTVSNIAFTAAHQQVIYSVALGFYRYAAAHARVATSVQSLKNAKSVQAAAEDRFKNGIGTVIEVAQARQATAQGNLAVIQSAGDAQDAYLALLTAMGISPLTKIKIADVSGRALTKSMVAPVNSFIAEALSRRPDVQSAYAAELASEANVRAARAEFMPKVFLSANGTYSSGGLDVTALPSAGQEAPTVNISGNRFGGTILAGLTVPVYDGGTRAAALAQARAAADNADAGLTRAKEDAVRQIVQAEDALDTSLSAYSAAQSLVTAAQTTFDAALTAYRSGVGSITDLILAQSQLLQAKSAMNDAYSTALSAAATLAFSTGALGSAPE